MKLLKNIVIVLVLLAGVVILGKDVIARTALTGGIKLATGLNAQAAGMQVGIFKPIVGIQGLKIMNPSGYPDPVMVSLKEFFIDYDLKSFIGGKPHLRKLKLDLEEVTIVKREDNQVNIQQIKALQQKPRQPAKPGEAKPAGKPPEIKIDSLDLKIGKVIFKDYTRQPASEKVFDLGISEQHENIGDLNAVAGMIVLKIMAKTGLAAITNIDVADLQANVDDALAFSQQAAAQVLSGAQQVTGELGNTGKQAAGAAKDAADSLKKLFKN